MTGSLLPACDRLFGTPGTRIERAILEVRGHRKPISSATGVVTTLGVADVGTTAGFAAIDSFTLVQGMSDSVLPKMPV